MIQDITRSLSLRTDQEIQETDCTIVVCMLNAPPNQWMLSHAEQMNIGPHVNALCQELERHRRPAIIIGGSAELWEFPLEWNHLVGKCVTMCRAHGFPTIDGTQYFRRMQTQEYGFHFIKTPENMEHGMHMLEETRNMLYGLWPHGCFSHFVELPPPPPVLPILTQVGLQAAPTQVGQSSGSSSSDSPRISDASWGAASCSDIRERSTNWHGRMAL